MQTGSIHCHVSNRSRRNSRGQNRTALVKAAYNAGQDLWCEWEERTATFSWRKDVIFTEIIAPVGAPAWVQDRTKLWNKVDLTAKRKDSRLAKNITCAITYGIPSDQWPDMLRDYAQSFIDMGCVADLAIHEDGTNHNPHVHVMLTVNRLKPDGFGPKIKHIDHKRFVTSARRGWEAVTNQYLKANGLSLRVDARSFKARGLSQTPTRHRGPNQHERAVKRQRARVLPNQEHSMTNDKNDKFRRLPIKHDYLTHEEEIPAEPMPRHDLTPQDEMYQQMVEDHRNYAPYNRPELTAEEWERLTDTQEHSRLEPETVQEQELRQAVADAPSEVIAEVERQISHQRTQRILAREEEQRLTYLQDNLTPKQLTKLEQSWDEEQKHRPDLLRPEPGPNHDMYTRAELEQARDNMLAEYERDDEEPKR